MNINQLIELILEYEPNQLIMADVLYAKAHNKYNIDRKYFNVYLSRVTKRAYVDRLQRGIYYRAVITKFGKTQPNLYKETIKLYTEDNRGFFGYEIILNQLGLRNEIPRKLTIYTTNQKHIKYTDKNIVLKRIHQELNDKNIRYIQILYLLKDIDNIIINYSDLYPKLAEYILKNGMHFETFFDYLDDFDFRLLNHFILIKRELNHFKE